MTYLPSETEGQDGLRRAEALDLLLPGASQPVYDGEFEIDVAVLDTLDPVVAVALRLCLDQRHDADRPSRMRITDPRPNALVEQTLALAGAEPDAPVTALDSTNALEAHRAVLLPATRVPTAEAASACGGRVLEACRAAQISAAASGLIVVATMELSDGLRLIAGPDPPAVAVARRVADELVDVVVVASDTIENDADPAALGPAFDDEFITPLLDRAGTIGVDMQVEVIAGTTTVRTLPFERRALPTRPRVRGTAIVATLGVEHRGILHAQID